MYCQKTIDLRHHSMDVEVDEEHDEDVDPQTIFEAEQKSTNAVKVCMLF